MPRPSQVWGRKQSAVSQTLKKRLSTALLRNSQSRQTDSVAQTVPEDVLDEIFSWVRDQKSLKSCTTVCRSWYAPSTRALFYAVTIVGKVPTSWTRKKSALKLFDMQLKASPFTSTVLRTLAITGSTNFTLLREVIAQLKSLRCLSLVGISFQPMTAEAYRLACVEDPFADIDHVVVGHSKAALAQFESFRTPPYLFDALSWFRSIRKLDLRGTVPNIQLPRRRSPPQTRVDNLSIIHADYGQLLFELIFTLGLVPGWARYFNRYTTNFGSSLRNCTLRFNLSSSRDTNYVRYAPNMSTWNGATDLFRFSNAPDLQRLCFRFDVKVDDEHPIRTRALRDTWKFCMASLAVPARVRVLALHFRAVVNSWRDASLLLDMIQWSCLDTLVSEYPDEPPLIQIWFKWERLPPTDVPKHECYIIDHVLDTTRARIVFLASQDKASP